MSLNVATWRMCMAKCPQGQLASNCLNYISAASDIETFGWPWQTSKQSVTVDMTELACCCGTAVQHGPDPSCQY